MRSFWRAFCKEFWPRLFWATAIGHFVLLFLYATAPTVQI